MFALLQVDERLVRKSSDPAASATATWANKTGKSITAIHLERLQPAKMDRIILPSQRS